ncbi:hypothetical protein [Microscilla marina]|uniref:Uncharacterized protein n=1 Tax=Microscilla marina ATCC 23134 TaxID=313606 RepID=A1ZMN2_MICM2|nr:hypothetical protein [Microscilla marina]EAY28412.1 hypothetical protein M23134_03964 [Microscilla marina ATCC 23134]
MKNNQSEEKQLQETAHLSETVARTILPFVPVLGSIIKEWSIDYPSRIVQKRVNSLVEKLNQQLEGLAQNAIDKEYLMSEDFYDFLLSILHKTQKTSLDEKHSSYAKLLFEIVTQKKEFNYSDEGFFVEYVDELTPKHLSLLWFLFDNQQNIQGLKGYDSLHDLFSRHIMPKKIEKSLFIKLCEDLGTRGLIYINMDSTFDGLMRGFSIPQLGHNFLDYINKFNSKEHFRHH